MGAPLTAATSCLLVLAVLAVVACNGEDSQDSRDEASVPASLTRADYIERADTICQALYEQRDPLETEAAAAGQQGNAEAAALTFENAVEITVNRVAELEALPIPAGEERSLEAFVANARATIPPAEEAVAAIRAEKAPKLEAAAQRGLSASNRFNKSAIEYGFLVCGRGPAVEIG